MKSSPLKRRGSRFSRASRVPGASGLDFEIGESRNLALLSSQRTSRVAVSCAGLENYPRMSAVGSVAPPGLVQFVVRCSPDCVPASGMDFIRG